jgi:hypothetical protein
MTTTIIPERLLMLDTITLHRGGHDSWSEGHCAMEAVAWLAGEPHTDGPSCACPMVRRVVIALNDRATDDDMRTRLLRPLLPRIVGSRGSVALMLRRGLVAADWAVRVFSPIALEAAGLPVEAARLRALPEIRDRETAEQAKSAAYRAAARADAAADAAVAAVADAAAAVVAAYRAAARAADAAYRAAARADAAVAARADAAADAAVGGACRAVADAACRAVVDAAARRAAARAAAAREQVFALGVQMVEALLATTEDLGAITDERAPRLVATFERRRS